MPAWISPAHRGGTLANNDGWHVNGYIGDLVETRSASTANVVQRSLQQFMKWLLDEEQVDRSPLERMKSPMVPEAAVDPLVRGAAVLDRDGPPIGCVPPDLLLSAGGSAQQRSVTRGREPTDAGRSGH